MGYNDIEGFILPVSLWLLTHVPTQGLQRGWSLLARCAASLTAAPAHASSSGRSTCLHCCHLHELLHALQTPRPSTESSQTLKTFQASSEHYGFYIEQPHDAAIISLLACSLAML